MSDILISYDLQGGTPEIYKTVKEILKRAGFRDKTNEGCLLPNTCLLYPNSTDEEAKSLFFTLTQSLGARIHLFIAVPLSKSPICYGEEKNCIHH